jgi:hypothetical protein
LTAGSSSTVRRSPPCPSSRRSSFISCEPALWNVRISILGELPQCWRAPSPLRIWAMSAQSILHEVGGLGLWFQVCEDSRLLHYEETPLHNFTVVLDVAAQRPAL